MLERLWVIFSKETIDNLRDRRSVFNALFAVLINPIMYICSVSAFSTARFQTRPCGNCNCLWSAPRTRPA